MSARALARMSLDNRLRRAYQNEDLTLYFQPKLDLDTGEVSGVEAMIRWPQSDGRILTPGDFLSVAEDTGLIVPDRLLGSSASLRAGSGVGVPRSRSRNVGQHLTDADDPRRFCPGAVRDSPGDIGSPL